MSNAGAATLATGATGVDCSASSLVSLPGIPALAIGNLGCFHGPAKALYSAYPLPIGEYINPVSGGTNLSTETISSGNELSTSGAFVTSVDSGADTYFTNFAVANMIDDPTSDLDSPNGADIYLQNTMAPYRVQCLDRWEQIQADVIVNIADEDLETGEDPADVNNDQFWDFGQTL
jgi:hypothetical protein